MMGIFKKLSDIVSANVNHLLDKAASPQVMAGQMVREIESALGQLRTATAKAIANEKMLEDDIERCGKGTRLWQERAQWALDHDDEAMARRALLQKNKQQDRITGLETELDRAREHTRRIQADLAVVEDRHGQARRRLDEMDGRRQAVKARKRAHAVMESAAAASADDQLRQFERSVRSQEFQDQALQEMAGPEINLERSFAQAELEEKIDQQLQELKQRTKAGN